MWRPPQWSKPAMVSISVPAGYNTSTPNNTPVNDGVNGVAISTHSTAPVSYVFDAVLAAEHSQTITKTKHPVQTGSAIASHAYIEPADLVLYVLMSDVTPQYVAATQTTSPYIKQWTGNPSKSVSAYTTLIALQTARIPLTVVTRLRTYTGMLIMRVAPREDDKTLTGARFRVEFEQLFIANIQTTPVSARPNDTATTGLGAVNTQPPSAAVNSQFGVNAFGPANGGPGSTAVALPPDLSNGTTPGILNGVPGYINPDGTFTPQYANSVSQVNVPGAGTFSSVNTNSLQQIPALQIPGI